MKLGWQYKDDELQVFKGVDDVPPVFRCNIMKSIDLTDLARACGYRLEKLPDAVMRWEEISEKDYAAKFESQSEQKPACPLVHEIVPPLRNFDVKDAKVSGRVTWSTAAINMGMPEEDFPTGHQWPFPTSNADLEEHIARSPENEAAEYRIAVKKAIFRGPL